MANFVGPAIFSLFLIALITKKIFSRYLLILLSITLGAALGWLLWRFNPMIYAREVYLYRAHLSHTAHGVFTYFIMAVNRHSLYMTINVIFSVFSTYIIIRAIIKNEFKIASLEKRLQLFALLFCNTTWILGLTALLYNNHHVLCRLDHCGWDPQNVIPEYVGVNRDALDVLVTPVFLGIPILLLYVSSFFHIRTQKIMISTLNIVGASYLFSPFQEKRLL